MKQYKTTLALIVVQFRLHAQERSTVAIGPLTFARRARLHGDGKQVRLVAQQTIQLVAIVLVQTQRGICILLNMMTNNQVHFDLHCLVVIGAAMRYNIA